MRFSTFWLDKEQLCVHSWLPVGEPKAILLLVHGMSEHAIRYARFAEVLCQAGIGVYAHDQRGHGMTGQRATPGHYADESGWNLVVNDVLAVQQRVRDRHRDAPLFLFGHSMGSYIAQAFLIRHGQGIDGTILCGSNFQPTWLYKLARTVVRIERLRLGKRGKSRFFNWLTFGAFNRAIKTRRTNFDWLSRDPEEVDRYIADPLCGGLCSNQLWYDLLGGLIEVSTLSNLSRIDQALPMLVIGGSCDPVSDGTRLQDLAEALGNHRTQLQVFVEARHELLNEVNRTDITQYLVDWIEHRLDEA